MASTRELNVWPRPLPEPRQRGPVRPAPGAASGCWPGAWAWLSAWRGVLHAPVRAPLTAPARYHWLPLPLPDPPCSCRLALLPPECLACCTPPHHTHHHRYCRRLAPTYLHTSCSARPGAIRPCHQPACILTPTPSQARAKSSQGARSKRWWWCWRTKRTARPRRALEPPCHSLEPHPTPTSSTLHTTQHT